MIKIVIADDEKKTRDGLKKCISWKAMGVEVIELAEDGFAALNLASTLKPDIIVCDVRMPRMNGIELATKVRKILPECKIIFISGYSDKEYLKSAIQLKAVDYVEKPINIKELRRVIQSAVSTIRDERKAREEKYEKVNKINKSVPIIEQYIALRLADSHINIDEIEEKLLLTGLRLPLDGQYLTIVFKLNHSKNSNCGEQQQNINRILESIKRIYANKSLTGISGLKDNIYIISNLLVDISVSDRLIEKILQEIKLDICATLGLSNENSFLIGVGKRVNGIENISKSYQQAVAALQKNFYLYPKSIIFYEDIGDNRYKFDDNLENKFAYYLQIGDKDQTVNFINKLSEDIQKYSNTIIDYTRNIYYNLFLQLYRSVDERGIEILDERDKKDSQWLIITNFNTLFEIRDYLLGKINVYYKLLDEKSEKSKKVYEIIKYIQTHYADSDLSIKAISEHLHLTHTYLCMLFKKETENTINGYITKIRIEKAKEFIKSNDITLYEVAKRVGYSNPKYFSAIFKKITGLTPSKFNTH